MYNGGNFDCAHNPGAGWSSLSSGVTPVVGTWYYVTCTYDGTTRRIYVDGVEMNSGTIAAPLSVSAYRIGWTDSSAAVNGTIDEVRVYNRSLSQEEIINDMQGGLLRRAIYKSNSSTGTYLPINGSYDSFTDGDYTSNPVWTPTGGSNWTIVNGQICSNSSDTTDGYLTLTEDVNANDSFIFEFDFTEDRSESGVSVGGIWVRRLSGVYQIWNADEGTMSVQKAFGNHWKFVYIDGRYKFYVNDSLIKEFTKYSNGVFALQDDRNSAISTLFCYDNVRLTPLFDSANYSDANSPDETNPGSASNLGSTTHTESVTSPDVNATFNWSAATDLGDDYYYFTQVFDASGNEKSLAPNPGFELNDVGDTVITGWTTDLYGQTDTHFATSESRSGKTAALLNNTAGSATNSGYVSDFFPVNDTKVYLQSGWIRRAPGAPSSSIYMGRRWYNTTGAITWNYLTSGQDPTNWTYYEGAVVPPEGSIRVQIWLLNYNDADGEAIFDDIRFYEIEGANSTTGLAGYSIECDQTSDTDPDTSTETSDLEYNCTFTDGNNYFHLRPIDGAGNAGTTQHLGPYPINTTAPIFEQVISINESGVINGTVIQGDDVTINATITNISAIDKVWVIVWDGIAGASAVIYQGFLTFIDGIWTTTFGTNSSFSIGQNNYTVYVNDTLGQETNQTGNFTIEGVAITSITVSPDPQGLGQIVNITADISGQLTNVIAGITRPGGSEVNYSMTNFGGTTYYNDSYRGWYNGTYTLKIYANSITGIITQNTSSFEVFSDNVIVQVRTIQDSFNDSSLINLTDPPETTAGNDFSANSILEEPLIIEETTEYEFVGPKMYEGTNEVTESVIKTDSFTIEINEDDIKLYNSEGEEQSIVDWSVESDENELEVESVDNKLYKSDKPYIINTKSYTDGSTLETKFSFNDAGALKQDVNFKPMKKGEYKFIWAQSLPEFDSYKTFDNTESLYSFEIARGIKGDDGSITNFIGEQTGNNYALTLYNNGELVHATSWDDVLVDLGEIDNSFTLSEDKLEVVFNDIYVENELTFDPLIFNLPDAGPGYFGESFATGDFNGDGYEDMLVGASYYSSFTGRAYVYYGGPDMDNEKDVTLSGAAGAFLAESVAAGDFNGDGYDDALVSARNVGSAGAAYIFYGGAEMVGGVDVTFTGQTINDNFGSTVEAGNFNGDSYDDALIGAPDYLSNSEKGRAYVYYGGATVNTVADVTMTGESDSDYFGFPLAVGNVNGDSYDDAIVSAIEYNGGTGRGKVYVFYGGSSMNNGADKTFTPAFASWGYGRDIVSGNFNGDSYDDIAVGLWEYSSRAGRIYIYNGASNMNTGEDVTISGGTGDQAGITLESGDINNDGYDDLISGVRDSSYDIKVYHGSSSMDNSADLTLSGLVTSSSYYAYVGAGDFNGDGYTDIASGYKEYNGSYGRAYVYTMPFYNSTHSFTMGDFANYPKTSIVNKEDRTMTNFTLQNSIGSIKFTETGLEGDEDFSSGVQITSDYVYVDSASLPGLDGAAEITVTGIDDVIGYPRIYEDGAECTTCEVISWNPVSGVLEFSVTGFSNYTWGEENQSKVQNNDTKNISYYLVMRTQSYNAGAWAEEDVVINDSLSGTLRTTLVDNLTKLDLIWNPELYEASSLTAGREMYRVLVELKGADGNTLMDNDGNYLNASFNFTLDSQNPNITVHELLNLSKHNSLPIHFNWTATDNVDSTLSCNFYVDGSVFEAGIASTNNSVTEYNITSLAEGVHNWYLRCYDDAGGYNQSETREFVYDATTPNIAFVPNTPNDDSNNPGQSIYVNISSNDTTDHSVFTELDKDLLLWVNFENYSSSTYDLYDQSSFQRTGTLNGGARPTNTGARGTAFNYSADYHSFGDTDFSAENFTVSIWAKSLTDNSADSDFPIHVTNLVGEGDWNQVTNWMIGYASSASLPATYIRFAYGISYSSGPSYSVSNYDLSKWHHFVGVANKTHQVLYVDGVPVSTVAISHVNVSNGHTLQIGRSSYTSRYFNGSLDELIILNRSLTLTEVKALYNASATQYQNNFTGLAYGNHNITGYAIDTAGNMNQTETRNISLYNANSPPNDPIVGINSTDGSNRTLQDLHCYATLGDPDGDDMNVSVKWYKNNALQFNFNYTNNYANNTAFVANLLAGNTTKNDVWKCGMMIQDGTENSSWVNSTTLTIQNTPPVVTIVSPDYINITNRTVEHNWSCSDDDSDSCTNYEIVINESKFMGSHSCSDDTQTTTANSKYLTYGLCLWDNGYTYDWSVRAYDGDDWGSYDSSNYNITGVVSVTLLINTIEFGEVDAFGIANDTTNENPQPFILENTGNCLVNVSHNATQLWVEGPTESSDYKIKVDNNTLDGELGAFNWLNSITSWINVSLTGQVLLMNDLNFTDSKDSVEIDIYVRSPQDESPGDKSSTIIFEPVLSEE